MKTPQSFSSLYQKTVLEKDTLGHLSLYSNDVLIYDMWMDWQCTGLEKWSLSVKDWFQSIGTGEKVQVDFSETQIVESENLASFTAIVKYCAIDHQEKVLRYLHNRFTAMMRKESEGWKVFHQHTSAPINHETLKATLNPS